MRIVWVRVCRSTTPEYSTGEPMDIVAACMHLFNICCFANPFLQPSDLCIVYPVYVLNSVRDYEISLSI